MKRSALNTPLRKRAGAVLIDGPFGLRCREAPKQSLIASLEYAYPGESRKTDVPLSLDADGRLRHESDVGPATPAPDPLAGILGGDDDQIDLEEAIAATPPTADPLDILG